MMRKSLLAFAILASISFAAAAASAQDDSAPASSVGDTGFAAPVRIVGSVVGSGSFSSGSCATGFSQCPNSDSCTCLTVLDARFSSTRIGPGRANLFLTIDNSAKFGTLGQDCAPIYGELDAIAKKDSPDFDLWGASCAIDTAGNQAANGALGMSESLLFVVNGYATFTSSISKAGHVNLRFSGAAQ
jgi:hypothetical protein